MKIIYKDRSYEEDDKRTADIAYGRAPEREYRIECNLF